MPGLVQCLLLPAVWGLERERLEREGREGKGEGKRGGKKKKEREGERRGKREEGKERGREGERMGRREEGKERGREGERRRRREEGKERGMEGERREGARKLGGEGEASVTYYKSFHITEDIGRKGSLDQQHFLVLGCML